MTQRRAERVFEELALSILRGEIEAGAELPSERVLAERFHVARGTIRQATHNLAQAGLVRVSQGAATTVLDHESSFDLRVIALRYRLAGIDDKRELAERRILQALSLVYLASLRGSKAACDELIADVDGFVARGMKRDELADLEARVWMGIAAMGKNRFFQREVGWFYRSGQVENVDSTSLLASPEARVAFYRELLRRLRDRDRPAPYLFDLLGILLPA
jgi:DNA-binding FadR family transcriptional regulator